MLSAYRKECVSCRYMNHFRSQKCKMCKSCLHRGRSRNTTVMMVAGYPQGDLLALLSVTVMEQRHQEEGLRVFMKEAIKKQSKRNENS